MPRQRVVFRQQGWKGMRPIYDETPLPDYVYYAVNMLPADRINGGPYIRRADDETVSIGSATTMQHVGVFDKRSGRLVVGIASGEIYTWSQTDGTWTRQVTTANFATASITFATSGRVRCTTFANTYVISDGTNRPFTWDGTSGAGGLTSLSNAPSKAYGHPVVYYAKLFFIKDVAASGADRSTIVWSEENTANTGYEASGYNNAWTLSQTGGGAILQLLATNEALYYFRTDSIGAIRGAVTPTFSTSGVHDSISTTFGTASPDGATLFDNVIYVADARGRAWRYVPGSVPVEMMTGYLLRPELSVGFGTYPDTSTMFWIPVPFYRSLVLLSASGFLRVLFSADTGVPLCIWNYPGGYTPVCAAAVPGVVSAGSIPIPVTLIGATFTGPLARSIATPSRNAAYSSAPGYGSTIIEFGPFSAGSDTITHFSKIDAVLSMGDDGGAGATTGALIHRVSNAEDYRETGSQMTTVATVNFPTPDSSHEKPFRTVLGINRELRALRWSMTCTSFPNPGWGIQRIAVEGFPVTAAPSKAT